MRLSRSAEECWWIIEARVLEWPSRAISSLVVAPVWAARVPAV